MQLSDNNNIEQEEKKTGRRDARIEEKRRRLRSQRIRRAEDNVSLEPDDFDYAGAGVSEEKLAESRRSGRRDAGRGRRGKDVPLSRRLRLAAILLAAVLFIWAVASLSDYLGKRTDYRVTDEGYTHAEQFADAAVLCGIDVSEHQDPDIKWKKVKSSGVDFVFIRAGYRAANSGALHIDSNFETNLKEAEKAGLMVGVYFYSQALDANEGREEADFVLELIRSHDITLPVVIDYEIYDGGRLDEKIRAGEMYAASFYHDAVLGFCREIEEAGYESAVYANKDMLTNYMQADLLDDSATLWVARYDSSVDLDADYWFWQCTDSALAGGIDEKVDQDFWYMVPGKVYPTRAKFKGVKEEKRISIGDCRVAVSKDAAKLRHFRAEPKFGVTYEGKGLREGKDYVASVVKNTEEGTGYIILRGIGRYRDWIMQPFSIEK